MECKENKTCKCLSNCRYNRQTSASKANLSLACPGLFCSMAIELHLFEELREFWRSELLYSRVETRLGLEAKSAGSQSGKGSSYRLCARVMHTHIFKSTAAV
jgi:hypothetical protein